MSKYFAAILTISTMMLVSSREYLSASTDKPNIIYIMADDLGYGDAAPFGNERCKIPTPGMTRLAAEGMRFTDAHSIASVCVPSRLAIMTGRYPANQRNRQKRTIKFSAPNSSQVATRLPTK